MPFLHYCNSALRLARKTDDGTVTLGSQRFELVRELRQVQAIVRALQKIKVPKASAELCPYITAVSGSLASLPGTFGLKGGYLCPNICRKFAEHLVFHASQKESSAILQRSYSSCNWATLDHMWADEGQHFKSARSASVSRLHFLYRWAPPWRLSMWACLIAGATKHSADQLRLLLERPDAAAAFTERAQSARTVGEAFALALAE